jgi:hypothetical protein
MSSGTTDPKLAQVNGRRAEISGRETARKRAAEPKHRGGLCVKGSPNVSDYRDPEETWSSQRVIAEPARPRADRRSTSRTPGDSVYISSRRVIQRIRSATMEEAMAATAGARTRSSSSRAKNRASSRSNSGGSARQKAASASGPANASARQRPASASRRRRQASGARRPSPNGKAAAVREDVQHSARDAGQALSKAARQVKAHGKTPILMGGTALAGAAGGLALGNRRNRPRKVLGMGIPRNGVHIKSRDVAKTARQVGKLTETAGQIAAGVRRASEEGDGRPHLSPIEVVLRGLTRRR